MMKRLFTLHPWWQVHRLEQQRILRAQFDLAKSVCGRHLALTAVMVVLGLTLAVVGLWVLAPHVPRMLSTGVNVLNAHVPIMLGLIVFIAYQFTKLRLTRARNGMRAGLWGACPIPRSVVRMTYLWVLIRSVLLGGTAVLLAHTLAWVTDYAVWWLLRFGLIAWVVGTLLSAWVAWLQMTGRSSASFSQVNLPQQPTPAVLTRLAHTRYQALSVLTTWQQRLIWLRWRELSAQWQIAVVLCLIPQGLTLPMMVIAICIGLFFVWGLHVLHTSAFTAHRVQRLFAAVATGQSMLQMAQYCLLHITLLTWLLGFVIAAIALPGPIVLSLVVIISVLAVWQWGRGWVAKHE